jgi:hypothetical protein
VRPVPAMLCAALVALAGTAHAACGDALGAGTLVAASPRFDVAFRPDPAPIAVSKHFALDVVVCAKSGAAATGLGVDAHMPAHRHGMNYRPSVAARGGDRYRVEGLLLHMPGAWEFRFDVRTAQGSERVSLGVEIP